MKFNLILYIKDAFSKGTSINNYNVRSAALIGTVGHTLFTLLHLHLFKMPWDSLLLKVIGGIICLLLFTRNKLPKKIKPYFSLYWHFMLIYNLSFLITLTALNNHFIKTWFLWELIMIFILIMYVPHWLMFVLDLAIGVVLAIVAHRLILQDDAINIIELFHNLNPLDIWLYLATFLFAVISGIIFSYSNAKGIASEERAKIFKSLAGSIAHELRNPINNINLIGTQINELALNFDEKNQDNLIKDESFKSFKSQLLNCTTNIEESIANANNIVNIILGDLSEKKLNADDFIYINPSKILPEIIDIYGYQNHEEKTKVNLIINEQDKDLLIKAIPDRLTYIMFNLIKNALYYLNQYPNSSVKIGVETRMINKVNYSVIYVHDSGPGIEPHLITKLFDDFYTSGKKSGTGLGLAFCKRNMLAFGGDIICESKFGEWTKFSLIFPKVSLEEVKNFNLELAKKKILLIDANKINASSTKSGLEKQLPNIYCDIVNNLVEALEILKQRQYQLILIDKKLLKINDSEIVKKLRASNKNGKKSPIVFLLDLDDKDFSIEFKNKLPKNNLVYYFNKSAQDGLLYRFLAKKIIDCEDNFSYLGNKEDYLKILVGKKIIIADDQQMNRIITKKILESAGLIAVEAQDGKELVEIYKKSLDENGKSSFDIIATDIHMPPFNGNEASIEIRKIEAFNNISHHNEIPIIALTGNGSEEDIHHFFECQMTDYFVKGSKPELLIKIIANYLKK